MAFFGRKKEEDYEEDEELIEEEEELRTRKIRDLKPENKKKRKEPPKPWGKKERYIVLSVFLSTILLSGFLAISARDFKLPGFPRFNFEKPNFNFNFFKEETIKIGGGTSLQRSKSDQILKEFEAKTKDLSGHYALSVIDLSSGYSFGIDENEKMQAASLIKLPVLLTLYKESESGNIDLETKYTLKNSDKRAGSGSLYSKPAGTTLTYRDLARLMGKESDNTSFNVIRNILGDQKINQIISEIGMRQTSLKDNETSPEDISDLFQKLWNNEIINEDSRDEILGFLTDTIYEDWLVPGIPDNTRIAHKYGREVHVINDGGIVFTKNPFVVVIMTQGIIETEGDNVFPELSRIVYDGMLR